MSIRQSGIWCDVCNKPHMASFMGKMPLSFKIPGFDSTFHTHDGDCKELLYKMGEENSVDCLPDNSPIKIAVLNHESEASKQCPIERYEQLAKAFESQYGYPAPGKDSVIERPVDDKKAMQDWRQFLAQLEGASDGKE